MARRGASYLRGYRRTRGSLYQWARVLGNLQPWLELDLHHIIQRQVNRWVGRGFSQLVFGRGIIARIIRSI